MCYLAHCLLNANSKVDEGARCAGCHSPVVAMLRERGATIRQMPCPGARVRRHPPVLGGARAVRHAGRSAHTAGGWRSRSPAQIEADLDAGARVVIVGIDGSPTMGVELTASSDEWGGRPDKPRDEDYPVTPGRGSVHRNAARTCWGIAPGRAWSAIGQDLLDYDEGAGAGEAAGSGGRCGVTVARAGSCGARLGRQPVRRRARPAGALADRGLGRGRAAAGRAWCRARRRGGPRSSTRWSRSWTTAMSWPLPVRSRRKSTRS